MSALNQSTLRRWLIRWMYAAALVHLLVGLVMAWLGDAAIFDGYHRAIAAHFWGGAMPAAVQAEQVWWVALFGATVQNLSLWMWALIRFGDRQGSAAAWAWLIAGLVLWAPQDMLISWRAQASIHLWVDGFALISMLPPLIWLYRYEIKRQSVMNAVNTKGNHHV